MEFTVLYKDTEVTKVFVSEDHKTVKIQKLVPDSMIQPFSGNKLDLVRVYDFLKGRCYEDGRADLKEILKQARLESNDPWKWVRITHGITWDDFFWVRFPEESLTWKDVKIR